MRARTLITTGLAATAGLGLAGGALAAPQVTGVEATKAGKKKVDVDVATLRGASAVAPRIAVAVQRRIAWARYTDWDPVLAPTDTVHNIARVKGVRARVVDIGLCGLPVADYRKAGERFAREWIPAHLRRDAMARLQWHRGRGDTVAVVSGAFDAYLAPWCEAEGIAVLCSTLAVADGKLTGRYAGAQCVGVEKPRRVHQRFNPASFTRVHAYGDTREDRALLAIADERWYRGVRVDQ